MTLQSQVTIGINRAPNDNAVLELVSPLNNKGFLPPVVALVTPHNFAPLTAHVEGMVVYNTTVLADSLQKGLYINNGSKWVAFQEMPFLTPLWFYMPSFPINVSAEGVFNIDLWAEYNRQLNNAATGSVLIKNAAAPAKPKPKVYESGELNYYVTGYDNTVFSSVSLTDAGILNYTISATGLANVSDSTYMNIVFVVK
jgi:hypothetical protein